MNLNELSTLFDAACRAQQRANREVVSLWSCRRAGLKAVVEALRDEFGRIMIPSDDWNRMGIVDVFNEILASDGVKPAGKEVIAGEVGREFGAPAADVCVWVDDGNPRKRLRNSCGLQGANKSWAGMHWQCTACLKPISFKEGSE